jgi:hypothetical protein
MQRPWPAKGNGLILNSYSGVRAATWFISVLWVYLAGAKGSKPGLRYATGIERESALLTWGL